MKLIFKKNNLILSETSDIYLKLNILAHTQILDLLTGSRCGGHGICGADLIKIPMTLQKAYFNLPREKESEHLSEKQLSEGFRLACQCFMNKVDETAEIPIEII